jgi:bacterioferritin-associated ferredoxin
LGVNPDDEVCLCFHVSLRKIRSYLEREDPPVASLISDCLGAGTGCGWCVPYLRELHAKHKAGEPVDLTIETNSYATSRKSFHKTGERPTAREFFGENSGEIGSTDNDP